MKQNQPSRIDHDTAEYWRGASEKRLMIARCNECSHWIHPPRACCPLCWSDDIGHQSPSGRAVLYSFTIQPNGPKGEPLIMGWAELEEQKRLLVIGPVSGAAPDAIQIDSPLSLEWIPHGDGFLPAFRLEQAS